MEFNPDGSLKLSSASSAKLNNDIYKMQNTPCIKISKNVTRSFSPKLCTLTLEASSQISSDFIPKTFGFFSRRVDSTVKLIKLSQTEYQVTIGGEFSRCRDCMVLNSMFREYLNGNTIVNKGNCTFNGF